MCARFSKTCLPDPFLDTCLGIYAQMPGHSVGLAENRTDVHNLLEKYKKLVGEFLGEFKLRLKSHEVGIWKKKLSQTVKDVN